MDELIILDSIEKYNRLYGLETLHPMVAVIDLSKATVWPTHFKMNYGIYALYLKDIKCGDITYGRQPYDYQEGTIVSFAPGQVAEVNMAPDTRPVAHGVLFHPDFIHGTALGQEIKKYTFYRFLKPVYLLIDDRSRHFLFSMRCIVLAALSLVAPFVNLHPIANIECNSIPMPFYTIA